MSKWQNQLRNWVSQYFDLPADVMLDLPRITTIGSLHAYVENCTGLLHFSDQEVRIQYRRGELSIKGKDLRIKMMLKEELLLEGELQSIDFKELKEGGVE
ncbi:sporulation protein YqfC [Halobacillus andaensis]|uniref:Sporulation protein YqfC n=1 Tax=Halobacillus andaensis TaxID=1176239 RepID=A0A917B006_HALAA|nr:sporulation protein YqfC [Halobacillus andaensis]MBP2003049.1 sporulation protein YqfC [Halobacillus andaensis]GGF07628.1 sporulation protein YqfC [Halobacillus andaensis]